MATTLAVGDFTYKQELWVVAYSTFESDSKKDKSSNKRLESRRVCYVLERDRIEQKKGNEEKNSKKKHIAHHLQSVNQSINQSFHYQNQISFFPFCFTEAQKKKNQNASNPLRAKSKKNIYTTSNRPFRCLAIRAHSSLSTSSR